MDMPFPETMLPNIRAFFRDVHPTLPKGRFLYPEVFATPNFFPLQRKAELYKMMEIAHSINPKTVMEIGCDKGGGLYHFCQIPSVTKVIGCEIRGTPYARQFEDGFPDVQFTWIKDSADGVAFGEVGFALRTDPIDVLFIDGDKGRFKEDFDLYLPLMNPNGVVFMHDIQDRPTGDAYRIVRSRGYRCEEVVDRSDYYNMVGNVTVPMHYPQPKNEWEAWLLHWQGRSCGVGVIYLDSLEGKK